MIPVNRSHWMLWLLACLLFVTGDMVTTAYGLAHGSTESNLIPAFVLAHLGVILGMAVLKLAAMLILFGLFTVIPEDQPRGVVPGSVATFGLLVVAWNLMVIA